jgi:NADH-quinone oxidoreductase subunit G
MYKVTVNRHDITLEDGESINAIEAAQRIGIEIPHYCWHPSLSVVASCRMCLVEVGETKADGSVAMIPKLVPGCQTPMKPGMVVVTDSEKVRDAQKATLEYLLLNHPLDCPVCDQAGECFLQDYSYRFGRDHTRLREPKLRRDDKTYIGDQITLFTDRCVMCSRCVRFTKEISGTRELQVIDRGSHSEIDIFPGQPCNNKLAGNVVDLCPVGALCSKDFLYKQRVWWLKTTPSVCPNCSTGCSIHVDQNENTIYRLRPRTNLQAQGHFMCDEGRFGFKYANSSERLELPRLRAQHTLQLTTWKQAYDSIRQICDEASNKGSGPAVGVLSPWMTIEEAYLLAGFLKNRFKQIRLVLGPVRDDGADDAYPKDIHGKAVPNPLFVIRAEKAPNRLGVEAVIEHFEGSLSSIDSLTGGSVDAVYLVDSDPFFGFSAAQVQWLAGVRQIIMHSLFENDLTKRANVVLPASSFAEKEGTFVNHAGLAQPISRSINPRGEGRTDGRILWELSDRSGLFHAPTIREEIAANIGFFEGLPAALPSNGVFLPIGGGRFDKRRATALATP